MESDDFSVLRPSEGPSDSPGSSEPGAPLEGAGIEPNAVASLVADLIEATGLISRDRLSVAISRAGQGSLAEALVAENLVSHSAHARALADRLGLPFIDLNEVGVEANAAEAIPVKVLERVLALPYKLENDRLKIAVADPANVQGIDELRMATRYPLDLAVTPREDIEAELRRMTRATEALERTSLVDVEYRVEDDDDDLEAEDGLSDAPLVRLVNSIILQAAEDGASDVHFDPTDEALVVRFRVDGVLSEVQRVPRRLSAGVTTRPKVLSKLDIAERRRPQDGRISLNAKSAGRDLDIRVAVLPTVEGESVVMRLVDKSKRAPTFSDLGMTDEMREQLEELVKMPTGALLVTGPTGSGKSTTLYAALGEINNPEINIITVEFRLTGVNQVQINQKAGLNFATALRSILRSDPDTIMVGEIRDVETAKMAIEAALTGHFVLSTLHTNDAPSALSRLNEMGVEPFLTGAAVTAVMAQRLARKLCNHCCEMYMPTQEEMLEARFTLEQASSADGVALYRKRGCPRCNQTGYKGRLGIYQLMMMTDELERLAAQRASRDELERAAMEAGMQTLWQDGLKKAASGLTSIEELGRVLI